MNDSELKNELKKYITGLVLCLAVTGISFAFVMISDYSSLVKMIIISLLAGVQLALQTYFFLHLGQHSTSRWNSATYAFMVMTVTIIVLGSLWVMNNLNYNMMHDMPKEEKNIILDEGYDSGEHRH